MISKKVFINVMNNIKEQMKIVDDFSDALGKLCDGCPAFDVNNLYLQSLLDILNEEFKDECDYIGWWIFEDVDKVLEYTKKDLDTNEITEIKIDVSTPDKLYDFMIEKLETKKGDIK